MRSKASTPARQADGAGIGSTSPDAPLPSGTARSAGPPHLLAWPFIVAISLYQFTLSPLIGGHCRFQPTCSRYALEAYRTLNPLYATWLTVRRLLRCHPLGRSGWDPPPGPRR